MFWKAKEKLKTENNDEDIIDKLIDSQSNSKDISSELDKEVNKHLSTGIYKIVDSQYDIDFIFNDGFTYSSWNANKDFAWLSSGNKITTPRKEIVDFPGDIRVRNNTMKLLMKATFENNYKKLSYKIPEELEKALSISSRNTKLMYEVQSMQNTIKESLDSIQKEKEDFKKEYGKDILEILEDFKNNNK